MNGEKVQRCLLRSTRVILSVGPNSPAHIQQAPSSCHSGGPVCSSLISMDNGSPDAAIGNYLRSSLQPNIEVREMERKGRIAVYVGNGEIGMHAFKTLSFAQQDKVFLLNPCFFWFCGSDCYAICVNEVIG